MLFVFYYSFNTTTTSSMLQPHRKHTRKDRPCNNNRISFPLCFVCFIMFIFYFLRSVFSIIITTKDTSRHLIIISAGWMNALTRRSATVVRHHIFGRVVFPITIRGTGAIHVFLLIIPDGIGQVRSSPAV